MCIHDSTFKKEDSVGPKIVISHSKKEAKHDMRPSMPLRGHYVTEIETSCVYPGCSLFHFSLSIQLDSMESKILKFQRKNQEIEAEIISESHSLGSLSRIQFRGCSPLLISLKTIAEGL